MITSSYWGRPGSDPLGFLCGVSTKTEFGDFEFAELSAWWGYSTAKDGEYHEICLCEPCYDQVIVYIESLGGKAAKKNYWKSTKYLRWSGPMASTNSTDDQSYELQDGLKQQSRKILNRLAEIRNAPLPDENELPELTEKQQERIEAFALREEIKGMR